MSDPESDESVQAKWEKRKAELVEEIQQFEHQLTEVQTQMKATPHHLEWKDMPEPEKFRRLAPSRKQLVDTVRMIAYRAETAMASVVREAMAQGMTPAASCATCFARRPTCFPKWSSRS